MTRVLTQSELTTFMRDRRQWYLGYYRSLRKRYDTPYLPTVGTLVHYGLESYYRQKDEHPVDAVKGRAMFLIDRNPEAAETIAEAAGLAGIMLEGYLDWVEETGADAVLDVYAAEETVEVQLSPHPFILRGKIDARARDSFTGAHIQLEHKTVGSLADLPKTAQSSFQFLTYDLLAYLKSVETSEHAYRTDGVLLNMLRRVKRTARAKPPFYGRHIVRHNTNELRNHWRHVVGIAQEIERTTSRLNAGEDHHMVCPPTVTRDSAWQNPFLPVYQLMDDGSDAEGMLAEEYETHDPNERYTPEEDA